MLPIPLPWLIVGVLISLFGTYRVGHHYGWLERDNDMKIAIAKKNEESRQIEQNMSEKLNQSSQYWIAISQQKWIYWSCKR